MSNCNESPCQSTFINLFVQHYFELRQQTIFILERQKNDTYPLKTVRLTPLKLKHACNDYHEMSTTVTNITETDKKNEVANLCSERNPFF